jgi:class 3 adenylate cyclase
MLDQANRTFICSVVFIDLVGYSRKPVTEQIRLKTSLTNSLSEAIKDIPVNDRIILDTGDGAAISFLGDPEDALFVTLSLREAMNLEGPATPPPAEGEEEGEEEGRDSVRMGINLGPVKLVKDINGHPNIIGDGINVAQRIMSFARPGQIVVSRSYYDVVSNLASEYAKLFQYEGSRTDKHVREHEIYVVGHHEGAIQKARAGMADRASTTSPSVTRPKMSATGSETVTLTVPNFVQDRKKLTMLALGLGVLVIVLAVLVAVKKPSRPDEPVATAPATTTAAAPPATTAAPATTVAAAPATTAPAANGPKPAEAAKPAEPAKPDAKVLSPAPPAGSVPAAPKEPPKAEPGKADAVKAEAAKALASATPPATLVFSVQPWGEIFVNGKSRGVVPPMKSLKLEPGKYRIEVKNTTFPTHVENLDLKARDEVTVRHKFQ